MKITLFANTDWYLYNFRRPLIRSLEARGDEVLLVSPAGEYHQRLLEEGFNWIAFNLSRSGINPFKEAAVLTQLKHLYQQHAADVYIHFTIKCVIYGSLAVPKTGKAVIINSIDGLGYVFSSQEMKARLLRLFVKPLYRLALKGSHVLFQNPDDRDLFVHMRLMQGHQGSLIKGVGVDPVETPAPASSSGKLQVTYAGRLLYSKGVADFVTAAREVHKRGMEARFVLVGVGDSGNPESISDEKLNAWMDEGVIEWWGWQADMGKVYAQTDVFCLPSYREGIPRSLMEAAAFGIPLIATDVPGCREVVRHEVNGLLVPPRDTPALTDAMMRLLENAPLRMEMGRQGQALIEKEFSTQKIVKQTVDLIDCLYSHR